MKNCLKYITLIGVSLLLTTPAIAGKKFMPLKPAEDTLVFGKKFIGLGGGHDPIRMATLKQEFHSLRPAMKHLKTPTKLIDKTDKEPTPTDEAAIEPVETKGNVDKDDESHINPHYEPSQEQFADTILPWNKPVTHLWPVDENVKSRVSSPFGYRTHPVTGKYSFHKGLDIAAPKGTTVMASSQGEVTDMGRHKNLGKFVKVVHEDGSYSLYGHLSKITAQIGHNVSQGEKIGEVGSTGRSTGPHLDYSLRRNGKAVNPAKHLKRRSSQNIALSY